jgi:hypothetical protein
MKTKNFLILALIFSLSIIYFSCDDSGVNVYAIHRGVLSLKVVNLRPLDPNVNGMYEAWIRLDTAPGAWYYSSLGKFNIDANGNPIDANGQPADFKYTGDTTKLYLVTHCLISVEPPNSSGNISGPRILDCQLTKYTDSLAGNLTIGGTEALDSVGRALLANPSGCWYTLMSKTSDNPVQDCAKGVWLCGSTGDSALPTLGKLPANSMWVYQGWIADTLNAGGPYYYSIGRFTDPRHSDDDGAGSCAGPNTANAPDRVGEEWIQPNCQWGGKPSIVNLSAGYYQVFVTIEPANELIGSNAYNNPFPFKLFEQNLMIAGCYRADNLFNPQNWNGGEYPRGHFYIKY